MAVFLRPNADVAVAAPEAGVSEGTYADIDETTASDADFIETKFLRAGDFSIYRCALTNPTANTDRSGVWTIRWRVSGSPTIALTVGIYEGSTLLASNTAALPGSTVTTRSFTPDMSALGDDDNLELQFRFERLSGGSGERGKLYWAEVEAPNTNYNLALDPITIPVSVKNANFIYGASVDLVVFAVPVTMGDVSFAIQRRSYSLSGTPRETRTGTRKRREYGV